MSWPPVEPFDLPAHWTPQQALAVFEFLELLRDRLCHLYGPEIQDAFREDQQPESTDEFQHPSDDPPF